MIGRALVKPYTWLKFGNNGCDDVAVSQKHLNGIFAADELVQLVADTLRGDIPQICPHTVDSLGSSLVYLKAKLR